MAPSERKRRRQLRRLARRADRAAESARVVAPDQVAELERLAARARIVERDGFDQSLLNELATSMPYLPVGIDPRNESISDERRRALAPHHRRLRACASAAFALRVIGRAPH